MNDFTWSALRRLRLARPLLRDVGAVLLTLVVFVATAWMPAIALPLPFVVIGAGLVLAALVFGRPSAFLAALVAALAFRFWPFGTAAEEAATLQGFLLLAVTLGASLGASAVLEALRRRRAEAERAHATMDVAVRAATGRLERARAKLREVEEVRLDTHVQAQVRHGAQDVADTFQDARRSEGGI